MIKQHTLSKFGKKSVARFAMILAALSLALPLSVIGSATSASNALASSALVDQSSFRVLIGSPVHLGDSGVGDDYEVIFDAPDVNAGMRAVLLLRTRDVDFSNNVITINGVAVTNALLPHHDDHDGEYFSEIGIVGNNTLTEAGNRLFIGSRNADGNIGGQLDDFEIDNVVLIYRQQ